MHDLLMQDKKTFYASMIENRIVLAYQNGMEASVNKISVDNFFYFYFFIFFYCNCNNVFI